MSSRNFVQADHGATPTQWIIAAALVLVLVSGTFLGIAAGLFEESRESEHLMRSVQAPIETVSAPTLEAETEGEGIAPGAKFLSVPKQ